MKKTYFSPESEIVLLNMNLSLLAGSEKDEISGDPVPVVNPEDDEDDGGW